MIEPLSLSIFTIEADRKPVMAFAAKKHTDAEAFSKDEMVRTKLRLAIAGGVALCDELTTLGVRLATPTERARYRERIAAGGDFGTVFLVDIDIDSE
jgi:hypothetical protein